MVKDFKLNYTLLEKLLLLSALFIFACDTLTTEELAQDVKQNIIKILKLHVLLKLFMMAKHLLGRLRLNL